MGAASRLAYDVDAPPRPHLRVVRLERPPTRRSARPKTNDLRLLFHVCCAGLLLLAGVGLLRVSLAVQAAEAAIDGARIERTIKSESLRTRALEADRSALEAPSRIAAIAGCTLQMTETGKVEYICLPGQEPGEDVDAAASLRTAELPSASLRGEADRGLASMIAGVLDVVAGEAQVLLVGDVGLSSVR